MKKLRRMVSVILCVVISCMCFATPVCAAGKTGVSVMGTNTPNIGIQRICMYPGFIDSDGTLYVGDPSVSQTYPSGTDFLNLTVSPVTQSIFIQNNCNCWVLDIYYCSDSNVTSIDFKYNGEIFATKRQTTSSRIQYVMADTDYFTYNVTYHLKSGATPTVGGHVNVW